MTQESSASQKLLAAISVEHALLDHGDLARSRWSVLLLLLLRLLLRARLPGQPREGAAHWALILLHGLLFAARGKQARWLLGLEHRLHQWQQRVATLLLLVHVVVVVLHVDAPDVQHVVILAGRAVALQQLITRLHALLTDLEDVLVRMAITVRILKYHLVL